MVGTSPGQKPPQEKVSTVFHSVNIPLFLKYDFFGMDKEFYIVLGPFIDMILDAGQYIDNQEIDFDFNNILRKTTFGVAGGIGYRLPIKSGSYLTVEIRDYLTITNSSDIHVYGYDKIWFNSLSLSLSYSFKI